MKIFREDWKRLRIPLVSALILASLGGAFVFLGESYLADTRKAHNNAKNSNSSAQKKVAQISEEEREIRENMAWYARMASRGMVDQENRLDLIDSIAKIKTNRKLFDIKYNIESQKGLNYPGIKPAGDLDLAGSRMRLEMQLLHEEDLLNFLEDLNNTALSYVSVRHCTLNKISRGPAQTLAVVPQLDSACDIDLIVVRKSK